MEVRVGEPNKPQSSNRCQVHNAPVQGGKGEKGAIEVTRASTSRVVPVRLRSPSEWCRRDCTAPGSSESPPVRARGIRRPGTRDQTPKPLASCTPNPFDHPGTL